MKRIFCYLVCFLILFSIAGCNSDTCPVRSGNYYAVGDYEEMLTPYLWIVSYAEHGTYEITEGKVIAASQSTTFKFEIKDKNTLVLIDNGDNDYFKIPVNTQFIYSEDLK